MSTTTKTVVHDPIQAAAEFFDRDGLPTRHTVGQAFRMACSNDADTASLGQNYLGQYQVDSLRAAAQNRALANTALSGVDRSLAVCDGLRGELVVERKRIDDHEARLVTTEQRANWGLGLAVGHAALTGIGILYTLATPSVKS